ncbi:hypothetical protein HE1_00769 [Holospora elegans E1]|uniref:Uncharacterized protein n=1 Tax=Holospora elegans E1 TaxID=1427503 RepID=A0A023DZJ2_9PROT|nr:hypothetical protein [Holospora elegans]GAJ46435.1 hypothetical protein HE1_00769 [Holospora elegans E1]
MNDKVLLSLIFLVFKFFFSEDIVYGLGPEKEKRTMVTEVSSISHSNLGAIFSTEIDEFNCALVGILTKQDDDIDSFSFSKNVVEKCDFLLRIPENFDRITNYCNPSVCELKQALEHVDSVKLFKILSLLKKNSFSILDYVLTILDSASPLIHLDNRFVELCRALLLNTPLLSGNRQSEIFVSKSSRLSLLPVQSSNEAFFGKICKIFKRLIGFKNEHSSTQTITNFVPTRKNSVDLLDKKAGLGEALCVFNYLLVQNADKKIVSSIDEKIIYDVLDDLNMKNKNLLGGGVFKVFTKKIDDSEDFFDALSALRHISVWNSSREDEEYSDQNIFDRALHEFIDLSCPSLEKLGQFLDFFISAHSASRETSNVCISRNGEILERFFYILFTKVPDFNSSFFASLNSKQYNGLELDADHNSGRHSRLSMNHNSGRYSNLSMNHNLSRASRQLTSLEMGHNLKGGLSEDCNSIRASRSFNRLGTECNLSEKSKRYSSLGGDYIAEDDSGIYSGFGMNTDLDSNLNQKEIFDLKNDKVFERLISVCDVILERKNSILFWRALIALNKIEYNSSLQNASKAISKKREDFRKVSDYFAKSIEEEFFHFVLPDLLNDSSSKTFTTVLDILDRNYFRNFWQRDVVKVLKSSLSTVKIEKIDLVIKILLEKKIDLNVLYSILDELTLDRVERIVSLILEKKNNLPFVLAPTLFYKLLSVFKNKDDIFNKILNDFIDCDHYRMTKKEFFLETVFCLYEDLNIFYRFLISVADFYSREREYSDSWIGFLKTKPAFFGHALVAFERSIKAIDKENLDARKNHKNFDTNSLELKNLKEPSNKVLFLLVDNSGVNSCIVPALTALCGEKITPDRIISALLNDDESDNLGLALDALDRVNRWIFRDALYGLTRKAGISKNNLIKKVKKILEEKNDSSSLTKFLKKMEVE